MNSRQIFTLTVVTASLLGACRERGTQEGVAAGTRDGSTSVTGRTTDEGTRAGEGTAVLAPAARDGGSGIAPEGTTGQPTGQETARAPSGTMGAGERVLARATLSATAGGRTSGTATIRSTGAGTQRLSLELTNATQGRYSVHLVEGTDCSSLATVGAGAKGKAEGTRGTATKAMETAERIGTIEVDTSGRATSEITVAGSPVMERRMVVLSSDEGSRTETASTLRDKPIAACGPLKMETGAERAG